MGSSTRTSSRARRSWPALAALIAGSLLGVHDLGAASPGASVINNPQPDRSGASGYRTVYDIGLDSGTVRVRGQATVGAGSSATLTGVAVYIDGVTSPTAIVPVAPGGGAFQAFFDTATLASGTHTILTRALYSNGSAETAGTPVTFDLENKNAAAPIASFEIAPDAVHDPFAAGEGQEAPATRYAFTNSKTIHLRGTAQASTGRTIASYQADELDSSDASISSTGTVAYTGTPSNSLPYDEQFQLKSGDGLHVVAIKFADDMMTSSSTYKRAIVLDTTSPTISSLTANGGNPVNNRTFVVSGAVADPGTTATPPTGSGVAQALLTIQRTSPSSKTIVSSRSLTLADDGTFIATVTVPTDGSYQASVIATDGAGNSNKSTDAGASASFDVDATQPQVDFVSPSAASSPANVTLLIDISDVHFSTAEFTLDGSAESIAETSTSGSTHVFSESKTLATGAHTLEVVVTDTFGNSTDVSRVFQVDADPPTAALTLPAAGVVTAASTLSVQGNVADAIDLAKAEAFIDGVRVFQKEYPGSSDKSDTVSFSADISGLSEGAHTLLIRATDGAGNTSDDTASAASRVFVVDRTAPVIIINSPDDGVCVGGAVTGTGASATVQVTLEAQVTDRNLNPANVTATLKNTSSNTTVTLPSPTVSSAGEVTTLTYLVNLTEANYQFNVSATDKAGKSATSPDRHFSTDTAPPTATILAAAREVATLSAGSSPSDTTVSVDSVADISGSSKLLIGAELVQVTAVSGTSLTVTRGVQGTTATAHPNGATVSRVASDLHGQAHVLARLADTRALAGGELLADGISLSNQVSASGTQADVVFPLDTTKLTNGGHTLAVRSTDQCGRTGDSLSVSINVDNSAPVITIAAPESGHYFIGDGTAAVTITVRLTNIDLSTVVAVLTGVDLNGSAITGLTPSHNPASDVTAGSTVTQTYTANLTEGNFTFTINGSNSSGVAAPQAAIGFKTDTAAPTSNILATARDVTTLAAAITASDSTVTVNSISDITASSQLLIGTEILQVTAANGSLLTVTRGAQGTTAASHSSGATVSRVATDLRGQSRILARLADTRGLAGGELLADGISLSNQVSASDKQADVVFPLDTTKLTNGGHSLVVRATDQSSRTGDSSPAAVSVDNSSPVIAISSPSQGFCFGGTIIPGATPKVTATVVVQFTNIDPSTIQVSPTGFAKDPNTPDVSSANTLTRTFVASLAEGTYTFTASGRTTSGVAATPASVGFDTDTAPPSGDITGIAPSTALGTKLKVQGTVQVGVQAHDSRKLSKLELIVDGVVVQSKGLTGQDFTGHFDLDTTLLTEGSHRLLVHTIDDCGRDTISGADAHQVVVDNTAGSVVIFTPGNGQTITSDTMTVTGRVGDFVRNDTLVLTLGSVDVNKSDLNPDNTGSFSYQFDKTALNQVGDGTVAMTLTATDVDGIVTSTTININLNRQKPTVTFISPTSSQKIRGNGILPVKFEVDDTPNDRLDYTGVTILIRHRGKGNHSTIVDRKSIADLVGDDESALPDPQHVVPKTKVHLKGGLKLTAGKYRNGQAYEIDITNVRDAAGNQIPSDTTQQFTVFYK